MVPAWADCRLVRDGRKAADRLQLGLGPQEIVALNRLLLTREGRLEGRSIEDWFAPDFFGTNFWIMWSTMFSFQPWHSLAEMRRYLRRFLHLFPGLARIAGILRTRYNQYDSIVAPVLQWVSDRGLHLRTNCSVADVTIAGDSQCRQVTDLHLSTGEVIIVAPEDRVYLTLGSMTDATVNGDRDAPPPAEDAPAPSFELWRKLAARHEGLGRPETFAAYREKTSWTSFTVTLASQAFVNFMEDFSSNRTGTGGLVTFADSGWLMSIVIFHQPHFRGQPAARPVFWGFGLRGGGRRGAQAHGTGDRGRDAGGTRPSAPPEPCPAGRVLQRGAGNSLPDADDHQPVHAAPGRRPTAGGPKRCQELRRDRPVLRNPARLRLYRGVFGARGLDRGAWPDRSGGAPAPSDAQ
jgi:oleate hydratase